MNKIIKLFSNKGVFVSLYILFMVPTYVLPYFGSNSAIVNWASIESGTGAYPLFYLHVISLLALISIAYFRSVASVRKGLAIFPLIALIFDLVPFLNFVPFVPTVMHISALVLGTNEKDAKNQDATSKS